MIAFLIPSLMAFVLCFAMGRRVDAYNAMLTGARRGLSVMLHIFPALVTLLSAIAMLRASGALDALCALAAPALHLIGIPQETAPLLLIRPFSGGGALAIGSDLMHTYGPDSTVGRTAAVMLGSTETTFYTIAVYFGAAEIAKTRYTVPAALTADIVGFIAAAAAVRLFF